MLLTSKYSLISPHWSLVTFTNLDPQKVAEQSRKTNHPSCEALLTKCVTSRTLGGGVWQAHNKLTHRFSERGRKQILFCQAKYTQTPYQFMAVMDPAGRRSPLASGGPLDVPQHIRNCMEPASACKEGQAFGESWGVSTEQAFRELTEERWRESKQVFMGQQQENAC